MRLLGIDYGEKRIGIALSDEKREFAFPNSVIQNKTAKLVIEQIEKICEENDVREIVLGESLDYRGKPNPIMKRISQFKEFLEKKTGLPVFYQSETLTTQESLRTPDQWGPRGKLSRKRFDFQLKKNDAMSAALILKSFIEKRKMLELRDTYEK